MKTKIILPAALIFLLLSGCTTPYQKHGSRGGYSEQKFDDRNFVVVFTGNGFTDKEKVKDFALLRSAEVVKSAGFDYFVITDRDDSSVRGKIYGQGLVGHVVGSSISFPVVTNSITCYKEKPKNKENLYEADLVISEIRTKYKIN